MVLVDQVVTIEEGEKLFWALGMPINLLMINFNVLLFPFGLFDFKPSHGNSTLGKVCVCVCVCVCVYVCMHVCAV